MITVGGTDPPLSSIPPRIVANDKSAVVRDEFPQVIGPVIGSSAAPQCARTKEVVGLMPTQRREDNQVIGQLAPGTPPFILLITP